MYQKSKQENDLGLNRLQDALKKLEKKLKKLQESLELLAGKLKGEVL